MEQYKSLYSTKGNMCTQSDKYISVDTKLMASLLVILLMGNYPGIAFYSGKNRPKYDHKSKESINP